MKSNELPEQPGSNSDAGQVDLPYFDYLLKTLGKDNAELTKSFGRHVHWGFWEEPAKAKPIADDFAQASEELSRQICLAGSLGDNRSVLDVGCGFGGTVAHINENFQGMNLVGVNLDGRQLTRARDLVTPIADNVIIFTQGNACALPLPDHAFDTVLAVECIFHFPDRERFSGKHCVSSSPEVTWRCQILFVSP